MLTDGTAAAAADEEIDSVAPRAPPAAAEPPAAAGPSPLGLRAVRLFGEAGPGGPGGPGAPAAAETALDFKLAAAVLRSGGGGGSGSDEDEVSEVSDPGPPSFPLRRFLTGPAGARPPPAPHPLVPGLPPPWAGPGGPARLRGPGRRQRARGSRPTAPPGGPGEGPGAAGALCCVLTSRSRFHLGAGSEGEARSCSRRRTK